MQETPRGLRRYLMLLHVACVATLMYQVSAALHHGLPTSIDGHLLMGVAAFIILSYVAEHTTLQIKGSVWQNLSTTAYVALMLLFAAPLPMVITVVAALVSQIRRRTPLTKFVFNVSHPALMVGLGGLLCSLVVRPTGLLQSSFPAALPGLVLLLALYYLLDHGMMLGLMAMLGNAGAWWQACRYTWLPELAAGTIGVIGAILWLYSPFACALLVLPIIALKKTFRASAEAEERSQALRRRGSQLETVLAVGQHLRVQQSRAALLQAVTEAARSLLEAEAVTGYLRDEEDPALMRRIALAPHDVARPGPAQLPSRIADLQLADGEMCVPIEPDGEGLAGLLLATGLPAMAGGADDDVVAILATQTAIALQNAVLHERALALAARDSLTSLLNRRAAQERLGEETARAERGGHPFCLLMIDLDDFSAVNNTYGHQAGDATLRAVAHALESTVRAMDVAARYGGDEFLVLLPETIMEHGLIIAERLRTAIAGLRVIEGAVSVTLTASIGVAALPEHGRTADQLIRSADQAAYAAKHAGKGRVARPEDATLALDRDPLVLAEQLAHANMATVAALAAAVDAKDRYTQGHSLRVSRYAVVLAETLMLPAPDVARIQLAGQLHDVGKIGVPDAVLSKPGKLTPEEFRAIQQHPVIGERMLAGVPFLREILPAVRHHHERWDGHGYPDGLSGAAIPSDATILAVADSFDAMTSSRTYRSALPLAEARRRILEGSGSQFDPEVVRAFDVAVAAGEIMVLATPWADDVHPMVEQAS